MLKPLFELGQTVSTPAALEVMLKAGVHPASLLARHSQPDPGTLTVDDQERNREALTDGSMIVSTFQVGSESLWVITDGNSDDGKRAVTTILKPDEY